MTESAIYQNGAEGIRAPEAQSRTLSDMLGEEARCCGHCKHFLQYYTQQVMHGETRFRRTEAGICTRGRIRSRLLKTGDTCLFFERAEEETGETDTGRPAQ